MGYSRNDAQFMKTIMAVEKDHQTDSKNMKQNLEFAYPSFKPGKLVINNLRSYTGQKAFPKVLDMGASSGAISWLFAKNGFNSWSCELEPNSLYSGSIYQHTNLSAGKRIVCDATVLPFENGTFDIVFCKEFAHHVRNIKVLMAEANRVLKSGGVFILIEPVWNLSLFFYLMIRPDEHRGHFYHTAWEYFELLKKKCFKIQKFGLYFYREQGRSYITRKVKQRCNQELISGISAVGKIFKYLYVTILGGTIVLFSKKLTDASMERSLPLEIEVISTENLVLDDDYLQKVQPFYELAQAINEKY